MTCRIRHIALGLALAPLACGGDDASATAGTESSSPTGEPTSDGSTGTSAGTGGATMSSTDSSGTMTGTTASPTTTTATTDATTGTTGTTEPTEPDDSMSWSPVGPDGWSDYEPHEDTEIIYVSSSLGDDANDGLSEATPVQTVARALDILKTRSQDATVARPDWVLFRAGDTWTESFQFRADTVKGGLSIEHPLLLGSYDEGPRPRFIWPGSGPLWSYGWYGGDFPTGDDAPAYWAILGLEFYTASKDPSSPDYNPQWIYDGSNPAAVMFQREGHHVLFEDCRFHYTPLVVQNGWPHHVAVRRSLFLDNYGYHDHFETDSVYHHAQGIYMNEVDQILIEDNVLDHNGWLSDGMDYPTTAPTIYNHNVYLNSDTTNVVIHKNISARGSADGFKARGGAYVLDNLLLANGINININGYNLPDVDQTARDNVVMGSHNRPLHGPPEASGHQPRDWGVHYGDITEALLDVTGNIVAHSPDGKRSVANGCEQLPACLSGHIVYKWGSDPDTPGDYPDPERTIESYMTTLGETPTLEAFLAGARAQSRASWNPDYTAQAVNEYIREGFGVAVDP